MTKRLLMKSGVLVLFTIVLLVSNCSLQKGEMVEPRTLATVELANGSSVEFVELEPGGILIEGCYPQDSTIDGMGTLDPVALYTSLTGKEPPQALRDAYQTFLTMPDNSDPYDPESEADLCSTPVTARGDGYSATQYFGIMPGSFFVSRYSCSGMDDYSCYTYGTGDSLKSRRCNYMRSYCHVNVGSASHQMKYKNVLNSWCTYKTKTVNAGYTSYLAYSTSWKKYKKASVFNADSAVYHASYGVYYDLYLGSTEGPF